MKKLLIVALVAGAFISNGCKKASTDPTAPAPNPYASITVPTVQEAFVGDITAQWCEWCGLWGIPTFENAVSADSTRISAISIHASSSSDLFYNQTAQQFYNYWTASCPSAQIFNGWPNLQSNWFNYQTNVSGFQNAVQSTTASSATPACGIGISQSISGTTMTIMTRTKFFTAQNAGQYNLAIYITEDKIPGSQNIENAAHTGMAYFNIIYNHILRMSVAGTDYTGIQLNTGGGAINANQEFDKTFTATLGYNFAFGGVNYSWTPVNANLNVVAVVYQVSNGMPVAVLNSHTLYHN